METFDREAFHKSFKVERVMIRITIPLWEHRESKMLLRA